MQLRSLLGVVMGVLTIAAATAALVNAAPYKSGSTPAGLQYDEIVRIVVAPATPPPPGSFAAAYQDVMANLPPSGSATAAPKRHGFAGLVNNISNMGQQIQQAANQMQSMMKYGRATRLAYYNGWVRTDDPAAGSATIEKCSQHQLIQLDLTHKTYKLVDTQAQPAPQPCPSPQMPASNGKPQVVDEAPGTAVLTISSNSQSLGKLDLSGVPAVGSLATTRIAMTNATGSCKNGSFQVQTTRYVSNVRVPRRYCPLPAVPATREVPRTPVEAVVRGGCKPAIRGNVAGAYWNRPSAGLEMYSRMEMASGQDDRSFQTVIQRGNVISLNKAQADALFGIPAGFTQTP